LGYLLVALNVSLDFLIPQFFCKSPFTDVWQRWWLVQLVVNENRKVVSTFYSEEDEPLVSLTSEALIQLYNLVLSLFLLIVKVS
jgi:hypothetical protein